MKCKRCETDDRYLDGKCKFCSRKSAIERYYKNPEKLKTQARLWKEKNREIAREHGRRYDHRTWALGEHEKSEALKPYVTQCECCGSADPRHKKGWAADHNHTTGKFRAFLCYPCNTAVGHVETWGLDRGVQISKYLERFDENNINKTN